jgi:hypothetical protein
VFNSDGQFVRLLNPRPVVTFISPSSGAVVSGSAVAIKVGLKTDASQSDLPKTATIYRNGSSTPFDSFTCTGSSHSCIASFTWNASRSAGPSTFVVKVRTTKSRLGASTTPRKLYASSGARIAYSTVSTVDNGTRVTISGRVVAVRTGLPLAGAKVAIVRDPAIGSTVRGSVTTTSTGRFSVTFTATSNTRVTATTVSGARGFVRLRAAHDGLRQPQVCNFDRCVPPCSRGRRARVVHGRRIVQHAADPALRAAARGAHRKRNSVDHLPVRLAFPPASTKSVIPSGNKAYVGTNSALMP